MKLTKKQLKQIIKEELESVLGEGYTEDCEELVRKRKNLLGAINVGGYTGAPGEIEEMEHELRRIDQKRKDLGCQ